MSQLDEFQKEFKDAQKRYKTALKEYEEANKRLSAIQQRLIPQDEHLKRQLQELTKPRLHLGGQNQISSQQNDREISCSPPMLPLLGMLTIWKYITRQEMAATYTTVVLKNLVEWATVMWS